MSTTLESGWIEPEHGKHGKRRRRRPVKSRSGVERFSGNATPDLNPTNRMEEWNSVLSLVYGSEHIDRIEITFSQPSDVHDVSVVIGDNNDESSFVDQTRDEYRGEGLVAVDTVDEYVIAVASSWESLDDQLAEADYEPENTLTLRCYE